MQAAGFVLVGGQSSRMGRDKALLPWQSRPLVVHVASAVQEAAGNVTLVGEPQRYGFLEYDQLPDNHAGLGPLSGIEAALLFGRSELNLIVACDMPAVESGFLRGLIQFAAVSPAACVVSEDLKGRVHPLCAVYKTVCLPSVTRALAQRQLRLFDLVTELGAATLRVDYEIANVNTPEEWERWNLRSQPNPNHAR